MSCLFASLSAPTAFGQPPKSIKGEFEHRFNKGFDPIDAIDLRDMPIEELADLFSALDLATMLNSHRDSIGYLMINKNFNGENIEDTLLLKMLFNKESIYDALSVYETRYEMRNKINPDNRHDLFEERDTTRLKRARSICTLVDTNRLIPIGQNLFQLDIKTHHTKYGDLPYCQTGRYGEKFTGQPRFGRCTAFAIDSNIVVTAGHCNDRGDCYNREYIKQKRLLFDYKMRTSEGDITYDSIYSKYQIFTPDSLLACIYRPDLGIDYAIIRTKELIPEDRWAPISQTDVNVGTPLYMIGHCFKLPMKVAENAIVESSTYHTFSSQLDAFSNNSGSPVFDANTHEVVGVHFSGTSETDYQKIDTTFDNITECHCAHLMICRESDIKGSRVVSISKGSCNDPISYNCRLARANHIRLIEEALERLNDQ